MVVCIYVFLQSTKCLAAILGTYFLTQLWTRDTFQLHSNHPPLPQSLFSQHFGLPLMWICGKRNISITWDTHNHIFPSCDWEKKIQSPVGTCIKTILGTTISEGCCCVSGNRNDFYNNCNLVGQSVICHCKRNNVKLSLQSFRIIMLSKNIILNCTCILHRRIIFFILFIRSGSSSLWYHNM